MSPKLPNSASHFSDLKNNPMDIQIDQSKINLPQNNSQTDEMMKQSADTATAPNVDIVSTETMWKCPKCKVLL